MTKFETIKQRIKDLAKHLDSKTPEEVNSKLWSLAQTSRMDLTPKEVKVERTTKASHSTKRYKASHARRNLGVCFQDNIIKNK